MSFELTTFDVDKAGRLALAFAQSGYFADAKDVQKAMVKIVAGAELGIGPMASMTGIHVIQGKPAVGAGIMASKAKGHPKYDYRVLRLDDEGCVLEFYQLEDDGTWETLGQSPFLKEDASRAGLLNRDNWKAYPRNMYFSRAMSNGVRWYCPDAMHGSVYTPEELGADVDEHGDMVIEGEVTATNGHAPRSRGQRSDLNEQLDEDTGEITDAPTEVILAHAAVVPAQEPPDDDAPTPSELRRSDLLMAIENASGDANALGRMWAELGPDDRALIGQEFKAANEAANGGKTTARRTR